MITVGGWIARERGLDLLDRHLLLAELLRTDRAGVMTHPERVLEDAEKRTLDLWSSRRRQGEPIAYILGRKEFWGLTLAVNPTVLIPRPETELLVECALEVATADQRLLDLGTGSGAVAIALARELDGAAVTASDVSQAALKVAAANAAAHGARVTWVASNWFENLTPAFDAIISNPPYVAEGDAHLRSLEAEPTSALVSGAEGLDAIRYIVPAAKRFLNDDGWLVVEHGHDHGRAVRSLMRYSGYRQVKTFRDLAGLERVTRGRRP
ncbi:MAG: peptide chain release factor N(5)-glutamine methyltransferase [Pseudomonadales bacterium]|nr:peptide chain release factor N(5)-glutamine methyltransferase [Pseudomonadales bacterium]NIX09513.1 peptide chain release factor N(5)-glutamine methyltransferase [Pseudomonadales bacterium]